MYELDFGDEFNELFFREIKRSFSMGSETIFLSLMRSKVDEKVYFKLLDRNENVIIGWTKLTPNINHTKIIDYRYDYGICCLTYSEVSYMQDVSAFGLASGDYKIYFGQHSDIDDVLSVYES